jgi:hypothetical protein
MPFVHSGKATRFMWFKSSGMTGNFVTVTVLGDSKGRGGVIIPEGRDSWGWRGISVELEHIQSGSILKKKKKKWLYSKNGISIYLKALTAQFHFWNLEFFPFCHLSSLCPSFQNFQSLKSSVSDIYL